MRSFAIVAVLFSLSGCNQQEVGRYQMAPINLGQGDAEESAVMVLDTTGGRINVCAPDADSIITCRLVGTVFP